MLCIAVAPVSRTLGMVDILNAAPQADLIELRLDRLEKDPDLGQMLAVTDKPILVSCRRKRDGGDWTDSDEERLLLLRKAIVAGPAYIELELDIARQVPRFGKTKRVISYTLLDKPLTNIEQIYEQCVACQADVVKLVGPTPTLEAAWPLLAAVSKKRDIPIVGMGLGQPGVMFSILGQKYGSPWIYAALEEGLEAFEGQITVADLISIYRYKEIGPQTRFLAVTGFSETDRLSAKVLNAGFSHLGVNVRCLPLEFGRADKFADKLDVLGVNVVFANPQLAERILNLAETLDEPARVAQYADLVVKQKDGWFAYNTIWRSALRCIEKELGAANPEDRPLDKRNVMIVGSGGMARGIAYGVSRRKGLISITSADDNEAKQMASQFNARFVPMSHMYNTLCDVAIICDADNSDIDNAATSRGDQVRLNASFFRPGMIVTDLSDIPNPTRLLEEARQRACKIVDPADISADHLMAIFKTVCGKDYAAAPDAE
jgi:3-dehydroquinate dehydratase/shikimate dehydrogenase